MLKEKDNFFVNTYKNTKSPNVIDEISIYDWFDLIKSSEFSELILSAREDESIYDIVKLTKIPCITVNYLFDRYKENKNIIQGTGLMYIDIDAPDFNKSVLNLDYIFALYKSFGGKGYSIIVKVDGLTDLNFKETYSNICFQLGVQDYVDNSAIKMTQFNVLSYDNEIFINPHSKIFRSINTTPQSELRRREKKAYSTEGGVFDGNIRFNNKNDYLTDNTTYVINTEGMLFIECKPLFKRVDTNRNNILLAYCTNLVVLNPHISFKRAESILSSINSHNFNNPVDKDWIKRIVISVFKYKEQGTLQPIFSKKKRIGLFGKECGLGKLEILGIMRDVMSEKRKKESVEKLYKIIQDWDYSYFGNISQKKIYTNFPISKKTVEKYYKTVKELLNNFDNTL